MTAANQQWARVLHGRGWTLGTPQRFGPDGFRVVLVADHHRRGSLIVTEAEYQGNEWLHASVAFREDDPSYADVALLHRAVFGRMRWSYLVFTPEARHINIHEHALHLWGRADGTNVLPDFGSEGHI